MRLIDAEHADAEVRCLLCDNPMKSENGCDGSCHYDEDLYNKVMEAINKLSTVEAEPVIRCFKCKNWEQLDERSSYGYCYLHRDYYKNDFFCKGGKMDGGGEDG